VGLEGGGVNSQPVRLPPQQYAVAMLLTSALCNKEIAREMGVDFRTVKYHLHKALQKTRARNRIALALMAERGQLECGSNAQRVTYTKGEPLRVSGGKLAGTVVTYQGVCSSTQVYVLHQGARRAVRMSLVERAA
jgi:DNA-binding CsgD family transcriptional regulator